MLNSLVSIILFNQSFKQKRSCMMFVIDMLSVIVISIIIVLNDLI